MQQVGPSLGARRKSYAPHRSFDDSRWDRTLLRYFEEVLWCNLNCRLQSSQGDGLNQYQRVCRAILVSDMRKAIPPFLAHGHGQACVRSPATWETEALTTCWVTFQNHRKSLFCYFFLKKTIPNNCGNMVFRTTSQIWRTLAVQSCCRHPLRVGHPYPWAQVRFGRRQRHHHGS